MISQARNLLRSRLGSNQDLDSLHRSLDDGDTNHLGNNSIERERRTAQVLLREARRNPDDLTKNKSVWLNRLFHLSYVRRRAVTPLCRHSRRRRRCCRRHNHRCCRSISVAK